MKKLRFSACLVLIMMVLILPVQATLDNNIQIYGANWVSGFFEVASDVHGDSHTVYIADQNNSQIQVFDENLKPLYRFGGYGEKEGNFIEIHGIYFDHENLYATSIDSFKEKKGRIQQFDQHGIYQRTFSLPEKRSDFTAVTKTENNTIIAITEGSICTYQENGSLIQEAFMIKNVSFLFLQDITSLNHDQIVFIDRGRRGFFISNADLTELKIFGEEYLSIPIALSFFQQKIYIADANGEIFCFSLNGKLLKSIKTNLYINGFLLLSPQKILATSPLKKGLFQIDWNTAKIEETHQLPSNELELHWPSKIWVDDEENILVNDDYTKGVKVINSKTGQYIRESGLIKQEGIQVSSVVGASDKSLYMLSSYNASAIYQFSETQEVNSAIVHEESKLVALGVDNQENLFALDTQLNKIWKLDKHLNILSSFSIDTQYGALAGLFVNSQVYISTRSGKVLSLDKNTGRINRVYSFEKLDDNINWQNFLLYQNYIIFSDRKNHCLEVFSILNESPIRTYGRMGGPKTWTSKEKIQVDIGYEPGKFLFPEGVIQKEEWVFVADSGNHRIQKIPLSILLVKETVIKLQVGQKTAMVNDKRISLEEAPFIRNNRTYVPLRFVAEAFDISVEWIAPEQKILLKEEENSVELWINRTIVRKNGQEMSIDASPLLMKNRTYVPIRFVAEALDARVEWESKTQTVMIRR